ncbi:Oidioi.mRNA.OKI2018_I69.XSR.g14452.t1.cds [Oikopleura dioica]|uniref:Oidioi.mRNA.OKI2018_I69.XSR.g14452.t1.cds n=1 Tax=Oikopleura dioica TaxID=34765 RepID=A0ABN7S9U4_OIKDI|nr:Oidioi.mRNA.OKI2018_I69.XSR.g14452.t1.cds [Oikopleura dioica]
MAECVCDDIKYLKKVIIELKDTASTQSCPDRCPTKNSNTTKIKAPEKRIIKRRKVSFENKREYDPSLY